MQNAPDLLARVATAPRVLVGKPGGRGSRISVEPLLLKALAAGQLAAGLCSKSTPSRHRPTGRPGCFTPPTRGQGRGFIAWLPERMEVRGGCRRG